MRNSDVSEEQLNHTYANKHDWRTTIRKRERHYKARKCTCRNREPSRINIKKILKFMKKQTVRRRLKSTLRNMTPSSSRLRNIAAHYKTWYMVHEHRSDCFFSNFYCGSFNNICYVSLGTTEEFNNKNRIFNSPFDDNCSLKLKVSNCCAMLSSFNFNSTSSSSFSQDKFCVSRKKLLMSGDIDKFCVSRKTFLM